ncbi:MAG: hypothetical protein ACI4I9_01400 [Porcipelethomonas sp.]
MKTTGKIIIAVSCVAVAAGGTFGGYKINDARKKNKAVADVVPVSYMTDSYWGDELQLEGTVSSGDVQKIMQDESMLVEEILVKEGDVVKKGTPVVKYDITLLELDLRQKENNLAVAEDNIKQANREIARLQNLKPSEAIPPMPEPTQPPEPTMPEKPQISTAKRIDDASSAVSGKGTQEDPYVFNCSSETVVSASFLNFMAENGLFADFDIYENNTLIYMWGVNGVKIQPGQTEDWTVGANVEADGTGNVSVDYSGSIYGVFRAFAAQEEIPEDYYDDFSYEYSQEEYEQSFITPGSDDYLYSKAEIAKMISDKQAELKTLELDKKSADIAYRQAAAKKEDGQAVSRIDGVVTSVNDGTDPENTDSAMVVIQGSEGLNIKVNIGELNLDDISIGSVVNVMSYETGGYTEAEVTSIDMTPVTDYYNWGSNPNSSTYTFNASVLGETEGFNVGDWVGVTVPKTELGDTFYIPVHYTREEDGQYYVMKAGENGRLEKQYIKTGKIIYGSEIEIKGGLTQDDKICFPYGKNIREGIKTRETDEIQW